MLDAYVWVFLISGGAPPAHFIGGYGGTSSERQPPMYFRLGGGTCKGISKPGWVVWSRVYVSGDALHFDTGLAEVYVPRGGNKRTLAADHTAVADHACRPARYYSRPDDGSTQIKSYPGRLRLLTAPVRNRRCLRKPPSCMNSVSKSISAETI